MIPLALLWRYFRTRKLHFTDREALENWPGKKAASVPAKCLIS